MQFRKKLHRVNIFERIFNAAAKLVFIVLVLYCFSFYFYIVEGAYKGHGREVALR
jgi:hypothetical protein